MRKSTLDERKCIGCGSCSALDNVNFVMTSDNSKAHLVSGNKTNDVWEKEAEITGDTEDASDSCPVMCINLKKD